MLANRSNSPVGIIPTFPPVLQKVLNEPVISVLTFAPDFRLSPTFAFRFSPFALMPGAKGESKSAYFRPLSHLTFALLFRLSPLEIF